MPPAPMGLTIVYRSEAGSAVNMDRANYGFRERYASRSALKEPSQSWSATCMAIAVPVNEAVAGPRAISVTAIVFGSIVAAM